MHGRTSRSRSSRARSDRSFTLRYASSGPPRPALFLPERKAGFSGGGHARRADSRPRSFAKLWSVRTGEGAHMIGYVTTGTNDFEKSKAFYERALAPLNVRKTFANERMQGYGVKGQSGSLVVCKPYDEGKATHGNG